MPFLTFLSFLSYILFLTSVCPHCLTQTDIASILEQGHYKEGANGSNFEVSVKAQREVESQVLVAYKEKINKIGENYLIEIENNLYQMYVSRVQVLRDTIDWSGWSQFIETAYSAEDDIWVYIKDSPVVLSCNTAWTVKIGCGTFLEVHYPYSSTILVSKQITNVTDSINLPINGLCAGSYHIWFVYATRIGRVVKTVQTIFINLPHCQCT